MIIAHQIDPWDKLSFQRLNHSFEKTISLKKSDKDPKSVTSINVSYNKADGAFRLSVKDGKDTKEVGALQVINKADRELEIELNNSRMKVTIVQEADRVHVFLNVRLSSVDKRSIDVGREKRDRSMCLLRVMRLIRIIRRVLVML